MQTIALTEKVKIPVAGLGLWQVKDRDTCISAITAALQAGYRHFDTAQVYGNESFLGEALQASSVPREELFVTTKIWNDNQWWDDLIPSFEKSLQKLQTEYVDLLLIHFPVTETRQSAWRRMEEIARSGRAHAIGVSNYTVRHLEELLREGSVKPAVNQVELHVYLQQPNLVAYCRDHGITLEAYSPLAHGHGLDEAALADIGRKYKKTPAQVMLRWCIEQGMVVLPKSVHAPRIQEDIDLFDFELDKADMQRLASLDRDYRTCWDPTHVA